MLICHFGEVLGGESFGCQPRYLARCESMVRVQSSQDLCDREHIQRSRGCGLGFDGENSLT
jgi:hypothetical protein